MNELQKLEEAEERFFIMTSQPDVDDVTACKYIQSKYGRENAIKVWEKYCKNERETKHN